MATTALPIRQLEHSIRVETKKARAEMEWAVFYSRERETRPVRMTVRLGLTTLFLKFVLATIARNQKLLIRAYQMADFTRCSNEEILKKAESLERIIQHGRAVLCMLNSFGRAKKLWESSLSKLEEQLDHFDCIATSLRMSADPEASLLMGFAVEQMAAD